MTDFLIANENYYDQSEEQCSDLPHMVELAQRAAKAFRRVYEFDEDETVVMDFACGVGLLSRELIPYAKSVVGVDISQRMVDEYNLRVVNQGLCAEEMRAIRVDILNSGADELQGMRETYDVVVCVASYHHFDNIAAMTRALTEFLKPGGQLLVIDLLKDENIDADELFPEHKEHKIVAHRGGFSRAQIEQAFDEADLTSFKFGGAIKAKKRGYPVILFIAQGVKSGPDAVEAASPGR